MADRNMASDREAAIVAAYRGGTKVATIQEQFGMSRSTLYHILRRSGVVPSRSLRETGSRDSTLAGLHELIRHQDRLLEEKDETIGELRRQLAQFNGAGSKRKRTSA